MTPAYIWNIFEDHGYAFFDDGEYNLNIFGIRSENSHSDKFDDELWVVYKVSKRWTLRKFAITTDPGKHWLLNPLNRKGTAILVPGQYRGVYKVGIHGRTGKYPYEALEQVGNMKYVRDNNRNNKLDFELYKDPANIFEANLKTNIHRASRWKSLFNVGMYSAGCQVFQSPESFSIFMDLCRDASERWGNRFTYTLFEEKAFN